MPSAQRIEEYFMPKDGSEEHRKITEAVERGIQKWLDKKLALFGWFSLFTIASVVVAAWLKLGLIIDGWTKK